MRHTQNLLFYAGLIFFAIWCGFAFKADLSKFSFAPLWESRGAVLAAALLSLINYFLRICRWWVYLNRLGYRLPFGFVGLTYVAGFAFTISPGKVGEMMRARYYRDSGIPLSTTAAAFFVERLLDLLAMVGLGLLAFSASSQHRGILVGTILAMAAAILALGLIPWSKGQPFLDQHPGIPARFARILAGLFRTLASARSLLRPSLLLFGLILGLVSWGSEGVGLMVISTLVPSPHLDIASALGIYTISTILGALSFLPGGLGPTEAIMTEFLARYGFALPDAFLLTLVCRVLTLWLAVGIGWLAVAALRYYTVESDTSVPEGSAVAMSNDAIPLCVDLDGTLIHSDLLLESFLLLIKANPLYLFMVPFWLLKGKAGLKAEIAKRVHLNAAALPYNQGFIKWLGEQKKVGRDLWLCTASNYRLADAVAGHVGVFNGVLASSDDHNLSGSNKARTLVEKFGERQFDYCGNHRVDIPIWEVSRGAVVVNGTSALSTRVASLAEIQHSFPSTRRWLRITVRALRLHQWAKNVLVFLPILAAHRMDLDSISTGLLAFMAFGLCASSVYLLNDMLDLEADRLHPRKSKRPFAAGDLSLMTGIAMVPILLAASAFLAFQVNPKFVLVLAGYYLMTVAYSFWLKRIVLVDIFVLAGLYTVRIVAGAVAVQVPLSFWMILFSIFLFLSLALAKRYTELEAMRRGGKLKAAGRGYMVEDLPILQSLGSASGYLCVLVLALYINSPDIAKLYQRPHVVWLICVLVAFWVSRIWLAAHRGQMHDDPVVFAIKDRVSLLIGVLSALVFIAAV